MLKSYTAPTTLVVAGAWNPDILSPPWVANKAMDLNLGVDFPVNAEIAIGNPTQRPTFEFHGIKFVAARNAITFFLQPDDPAQVATSISTVGKILGLLPHTPVTGFGFNFSYEIESPSTELIKTFDSGNLPADFLDDEAAESVGRHWSAKVKTRDRLLTVNSKFEGAKVLLSFNVHNEVTSAEQASHRLMANGIFDNAKKDAKTIAEKLHAMGEEA